MIKKSVRISAICAQKNFNEFVLTLPEFEECLFFKTKFQIRNKSRPGLNGLFELFFC